MELHHAAIGNGRVLALVSPTSAIDWLCLPRFDSPSVFGRLLDERKGGTFRILAPDGARHGSLAYVRNTNVTTITFRDGDDRAWEVIDFAPRVLEGQGVRAPLELVRVVRPLAGQPLVRVDFRPRPDYARARVRLHEAPQGVIVHGHEPHLRLVTNLPSSYVINGAPFALDQPYWFVLRYDGADVTEGRYTLPALMAELDLTIAGWRAWARTLALPSFHPEMVLRSALVLKLHAYSDTGAIIAAATTSIPEAMHSPRTWDYRYCWLRDAAFVVEVFRALGHLDEGEAFIRFLRNVAESGPLQPLYGIGGERDLTEQFLPHLRGYRGNGFVRIGNAAYSQVQHDIMGEMVLCLEALLRDPRLVVDDPGHYFPLVRRLVEQAIALAPVPDTSIWEFRTILRHYTFSRAMCWAAIHRGAGIARRLGHHDLADDWARRAEAEREEILRRAYSEEHRSFTQALDGRFPDASNLLLPTIGLVDARDPRFLATLDTYGETLVENGLMMRYRNDDDFGETTSAFTICSFWWVVALAQAGRLDQAVDVFERLARYANPVGLFSEDIDPATGELLGNFPQAYTHVGVIHAAMTLGRQLDVRRGAGLKWS